MNAMKKIVTGLVCMSAGAVGAIPAYKAVKLAMKAVVAAALALGAAGDGFASSTVYVSSNGDGSDGQSWETAYKTIADGVANAPTGATVVLDDETFPLSANLTIDRQIVLTSRTDKDSSIIDGMNNYYVTVAAAAAGTCLNAVTFTRTGSAYAACGCLGLIGETAVSNCVFRQCGNGLNGNCRHLITGNGDSAASAGHIYGCIVTNCAPPNSPEFNVAGSTVVENCFFANNTHRANSVSGYPGLAVKAAGNAIIRNCTIVNNNCASGSSSTYGIVCTSKDVTIENCIIWGNTSGISSKTTTDWSSTAATTKWSHNCTSNAEQLEGEGNISDDPLLQADWLHLLSSSPCRGKANANAPKYDISGEVRPRPATIGALEYVEGETLTCKISVSQKVAYEPDAITFSVAVDGKRTEPLAYEWDFNGDGEIDSTDEAPVVTALGVYKPSVKVTDANGKEAEDAYAENVYVYNADHMIYVSSKGDGSCGQSWETAYRTIAEGVANAAAEMTVVLDDETFPLSANLTIDKQLIVTSRTDKDSSVIDGQDRYYIFVTAAGTCLNEVTFTRTGDAFAGCCCLNLQAETEVANCVFRQCGNGLNGNCRYLINGTEQGPVQAGRIYGCIVTNCAPPNSPAFHIGGSVVVENCFFADNVHRESNLNSYPGLAIRATGNAVIRNCTIANNTSQKDGAATYGIACESAYVTVENCIIWGNTSGVSSKTTTDWSASGSTANWRNNCTSNAQQLGGEGNIADDPLLQPDGLHLLSGSPCRGKANDNAPELDISGAVRPRPAAIGALEYVVGETLTCKISASRQIAYAPDEVVTLTAAIDGKYTEPLSYAWDFDGDGETDSTEAEPVLREVGVYTPSVMVTDAKGKMAEDAYAEKIYVYSAERVVYVDSASETPKAPYMTPATAATGVDEAVTVAPEGSRISVKKGVYQSNGLTFGRAVDLVGENPSDRAVIVFGGASNQRLNLSQAGVTVANLEFEGATFPFTVGAFMYMDKAGVVSNCVFRNATVSGNSRYAVSLCSGGKMVDCVVSNVTMTGAFGILANAGAIVESCLVTGCRIKTGYGTAGGALNGGGVYRNCTVTDNRMDAPNIASPAGDAGPAEIRNCIFAGNYFMDGETAVASNDVAHVSAAKASYCLVWPTAFDYAAAGYAGIKIEDPGFDAKRPWHPTYASPCRNGGDQATPLMSSVDPDGNPRVVSKIVDLGCYECQIRPGLSLIVR